TQLKNESNQNKNEKMDSLQTAIEQLSSERRALIVLRYREGFNIAQIAKILTVPEGTVKSRMHRTLEQLRQIMERKQNG
ncbi:MAG: RNA polymerase sigma factor, partial [Planctomycetota bacterium]